MSSACLPSERNRLLLSLSKENFPLLNDADRPLWNCLFHYIDQDLKQLIKDIPSRQGYFDLFSSTISVGDMDIDTGFTKEGTFLFAMHAHLAKDYGVAIRDPWQGYIQRLRHIILDRGYAGESNVHLIMSPDTEMGDGLNPSTVSIIPDPSLGVTFGSVPDQMIISDQCPCWQHVSKRVYQNKTGTLGAKPHYVLAHLLNHQLNGPGNNRLNVLPFWATANTEMSQKAETPVKKAVSQGLVVTYSIVTGDAMKLDPEYWKWVDGVLEDTNLSQEIRDILEWEMELPQYLVITATGRDGAGNDHDLLGGPQRINNFVPMTIPVLKTPLKPKAKAKK